MKMSPRPARRRRWVRNGRNNEDGRLTGMTMKMGAQQVRFYYPCMKWITEKMNAISVNMRL